MPQADRRRVVSLDLLAWEFSISQLKGNETWGNHEHSQLTTMMAADGWWLDGWLTFACVSSCSLRSEALMSQCLAAWTTGCLFSYGKTLQWNVNQVSRTPRWEKSSITWSLKLIICSSVRRNFPIELNRNTHPAVPTAKLWLYIQFLAQITSSFSLIIWAASNFFDKCNLSPTQRRHLTYF